MDDVRVPVLIVGAGVAGLACSDLLAQQGVPSLLVERRRERFLYPKARNLSFRTLEILRRLGLADEVHKIADGVSDMLLKPTLNSAEEGAALDLQAFFTGMEDLSPEPTVQYCPQSRLEPILLADARRRGSVIRYGTQLESWEQDSDGATAVIRDLVSGETQTVRADYLLAADGSRSSVRNALGLSTTGHGALPIFVVMIYFRGPWRKFLPHMKDGDGVQIVNPAVNGIFVGADDDLGMFVVTYLPSAGESAEQFTHDRCREILLAAIGEPVELDIIEAASWQPYEQVADEFQCGRVFLVGDAAHTMPPLKAGGANCAIQTADNLAWKLAAVLNGHAGAELLASYYAERHPVGVFSARQSLTGPSRSMLSDDGGAPDLPPEEEAPMFALLAGYQYRSTATVPGENDPSESVRLVDALQGQVGTRVPHVWVQKDGDRVSTLDLLGCSFTVLTAGDAEPWRMAATQVSAELGIEVAVVGIDTIIDPSGDWTATTGLQPGGAVLVRPDEFVAWREEELPDNPEQLLRQALTQILAR